MSDHIWRRKNNTLMFSDRRVHVCRQRLVCPNCDQTCPGIPHTRSWVTRQNPRTNQKTTKTTCWKPASFRDPGAGGPGRLFSDFLGISGPEGPRDSCSSSEGSQLVWLEVGFLTAELFGLLHPGSSQCRFVLVLKGRFRDRCIWALLERHLGLWFPLLAWLPLQSLAVKKNFFWANLGRWKTFKISWKVPVKYF